MDQPIWKLVELCAHELAATGKEPFTRGDLIRCVQRKNPRYGPDSINPVIQGVTDNLKGGAPGAVGKDILHSVEKGLFALRSGQSAASTEHAESVEDAAAVPPPSPSPSPRLPTEAETIGTADGDLLRIREYQFVYVCSLQPERNSDGTVCEYLPQARYRNVAGLPLHQFGSGPFCKFSIPGRLHCAGVYAITVNGKVQYIGECKDLSKRYNAGYGNISPRNCFKNGQPANCRINNLILGEVHAASDVRLWFFATADHKAVERALRRPLPPWNRV